jgi:hypothetical protein
MGESLLQSFIAASKLRRWLARPDAPIFIKECKTLFDKAFGSKFRESTVFEDVSHADRLPVLTPLELLPLVGKDKVSLRAHTVHVGVTYSRSSTHLGNSLVLYYPGGDTLREPVAGSIKYIFTRDGRVRLAVQQQRPAPSGTIDPFAAFPEFPARIYSLALDDALEEVELIWLVCHYARWTMTSELCVVLALLRVSAQMHHMFHFSRRVIHRTDFHATESPMTTSGFGPACSRAISARLSREAISHVLNFRYLCMECAEKDSNRNIAENF